MPVGRLGRIDKGVRCDVRGCSNLAERSISKQQIVTANLSIDADKRRVYLCHEHYKEWKKSVKGERSIERARWGV